MTWNYRVFKITENPDYLDLDEPIISYGIFETYYNNNGEIDGTNQHPMVLSDTVEGLKETLQTMMECCDKPIIDDNTGEEIKNKS